MDYEIGKDCLRLDQETGESPGTPEINSETGESELIRTQPESTIKRPFKIPNVYSNINDEKKPSTQNNRVKKKIIFTNREASNSPVILFLLPTIFFFFPIVSIPLGIVEIILHMWAHKKNKSLRDTDIYYQSPMHVFVSEFCAACRFETSKDKIAEIQDIRNKRNKMSFDSGIECVRSIV